MIEVAVLFSEVPRPVQPFSLFPPRAGFSPRHAPLFPSRRARDWRRARHPCRATRHGWQWRHRGLPPRAARLGKVVQHVRMHQSLVAGMADAEPNAGVIIAAMGRDRTQAIMAGNAAAGLHAQALPAEDRVRHAAHGVLRAAACRNPSRRARRGRFHSCRSAASGAGLLAIERDLGGLRLKARAPGRCAMHPVNRIQRHEADIVPVARVFRAGLPRPTRRRIKTSSRYETGRIA